MATSKANIGYMEHNSQNIWQTIRNRVNDGFNFVVIHLVHPRSRVFVPFSDVFLSGSDRSRVVIRIPRRNYTLRKNVNLLQHEFEYANHIGVNNLVIDCPEDSASVKILADEINRRLTPLSEHFQEQQTPSICIRVPLVSNRSYSVGWRHDSAPVDTDTMWHKWNHIRMISQSHPKLFLVLELNGDLPDGERLKRWLGEPIAMLILPTSIFLTNTNKYPVLSKVHQQFVHQLNHKVSGMLSFIIEGNNLHNQIRNYIQYVNYLKECDPNRKSLSGMYRGYEDVLQIPLQPLKDNLDSLVYEVFESDDIKYIQYEKAIYQALCKMTDKNDIVAMVVGAGRGPLVEKTLKAARDSNKYVTIYAVEKNMNAIITLEVLRDLRWGGADGLTHGMVEIINEDMRYWEAPRKADLVISELLGSFGDNELSPECLDGVHRYTREDTISIPCKYTSYLCPVQSQKLYSQLALDKKINNNPYDYGYVVYVRNAYLIDQPQPLFTFEHYTLTKPPTERDNNRSKILQFRSQISTLCHGFVGYFDCVLFDDVQLSIVPSTQNADMYSWFPIYFPVQIPFMLNAGDSVEIHFTRNVDQSHVWYEWSILQPTPSKIHNLNGKHYSIDLH